MTNATGDQRHNRLNLYEFLDNVHYVSPPPLQHRNPRIVLLASGGLLLKLSQATLPTFKYEDCIVFQNGVGLFVV